MTRYRSESALQAACLRGLLQLGFWAVRRGPLNKNQIGWETGEPDIELRGLGFIELKQPGETLDPRQVKWHAKAKRRGVLVETVCNVEDCLMIAQLWRDRNGQ